MGQPPRLLVIDDSSETHELIGLMFGAEHVLHAYDGQQGLQVLATHPDIDTVILDLMMPIMDGFTLLEKLAADRRISSVPVCVFTGNRAEATRALALGARDFIDKRADYQELQLRIHNLVDAKRRLASSHQAKTDFLSVVSHELRTPMNGILGMAEAIRDGVLTPEQSRYLDILEQSARKMTSLVDDVLHYLDSENPLTSLPLSVFDPRRVMTGVLTRLRNEAERTDTAIESVFAADVPESVVGLPDKLGIVLHHLVGNAIKFAPGGKVGLSVECCPAPHDHVGLRFSVHDTGVGFPEDWKDRIFDPFTQVDGSQTRRFGGLGIGLSVASRMIQMLGGSLEVESEPNKGSLFRFALVFPRG